MPRCTPTSATIRAARGPPSCTARRRSPATTWWRRWTRSASTARCWSRLLPCTATTPATPSRFTPRIPRTKLVIAPLGLQQPFEPPVPAQPFADLPKLLELAAHDNVAVKITGACTLSHEPFPYNDLWDPLGRIFDAFGFERCMWGTD